MPQTNSPTRSASPYRFSQFNSVYLSGPIASKQNVVDDRTHANREILQNLLVKNGYQVVDPFHIINPIKEFVSKKDWFKIDYNLIEYSDFVVADLRLFSGDIPLVGTFLEIGYAVRCGKLVFAITDDEYLTSHSGILESTILVKNLDDLERLLQSI